MNGNELPSAERRYSDAWSEGIPEDYYSKKESEEAIKLATQVIEWVKELWQKLLKSN
jgi:HEPN domain-containing protein